MINTADSVRQFDENDRSCHRSVAQSLDNPCPQLVDPDMNTRRDYPA